MKIWRVSNKSRHITVAVVLILSLIQTVPMPAIAAGEAFTGSSAVSGVYGVPTAISDLQVSGTGNDTINVRLYVTHGSLAMSTTTGLTFTGASTGSPLQFSGTRSNINAALATLTYTRSTPGTDTLEASLVGPGEIYYPANGHLYEVITSTQTWTDAQAAAAARTKYGASGYLATITSAEENDFVSDRLTDAGWMGASDAAIENDWRWVTGPETGTSFWSGLSGGSAVSGRYENWADGEPNNASNEDCAQFLAGGSGEWNDLPCTVTTLPRYVVEYGTSGTLPAVQSKNVAITTGTSTRSISNCTQLQNMADTAYTDLDTYELTTDIDCAGIANFAPIGSGGSAAWSSFKGTFDGNGHSIKNLTINDTNGNAALFQGAERASFHDLILESGSVTGAGNSVGALISEADEVVLANITSHLNVTGRNETGGLVGVYLMTGQDITWTNLHVDGVITASNIREQTGGLIGGVQLYDGAELTITRSAFTGEVTGGTAVGGLLGQMYMEEDGNTGLTISDSYTAATIEGEEFVGGLIGWAEPVVNTGNNAGLGYLTIQRSYTNSQITANDNRAGGFIGITSRLDTAGEVITITDSFAASGLSSANDSRSLFYMDGSVTNGTLTLNDVYIDDLRSNVASWSNIATPGVGAINTTGNPDTDYFFRTTTQEPLDEWDFSSGNVWYAHPNAFPTHEAGTDDDGDGTPTANEDSGPNGGDANNDGILDSQQGNVTSFINGFTGKTVAIELSNACRLTSISMRSEALLTTKDSGFDYPQGLVRFVADCGTPGFAANAKLFFYDVAKGSLSLRKHNPARSAYYAMPNAVVGQVTINGTTVTTAAYEVTDGTTLDEDATMNGIIVDPAGLAISVVGAPNTGLGGSAAR